MTLEDLGLGVRATNCLHSAGINTVGQLILKTESELMELRSFGRTSLSEIESRLHGIGMSLGMPSPTM
jgi:DNA-directed RNA polymerase subunit alpha